MTGRAEDAVPSGVAVLLESWSHKGPQSSKDSPQHSSVASVLELLGPPAAGRAPSPHALPENWQWRDQSARGAWAPSLGGPRSRAQVRFSKGREEARLCDTKANDRQFPPTPTLCFLGPTAGFGESRREPERSFRSFNCLFQLVLVVADLSCCG